jgi:hypothetical protein
MFDLNSETLIYSLRGILVVLKNNLNGFWDFYHVTKVGACSPKVSSCIYVQGQGWTRTHTGTFAQDNIHWVCAVQCSAGMYPSLADTIAILQ